MGEKFDYAQAEEIRDTFARHGVRYLFLGKSGAILLGFPDTTQHADLFVEKRIVNWRAIVAALREPAFAVTGSEAADIERGKQLVQLKNGSETGRHCPAYAPFANTGCGAAAEGVDGAVSDLTARAHAR